MSDRLFGELRMPFGKFVGKKVFQCPSSYLLWLLEQDWFEEEYAELFEDVQLEYNWREEAGTHFEGEWRA